LVVNPATGFPPLGDEAPRAAHIGTRISAGSGPLSRLQAT
jgi:hypothetical protein